MKISELADYHNNDYSLDFYYPIYNDLLDNFKVGDIIRTKDSIGEIMTIFYNGVIKISDGQNIYYLIYKNKNISLATNEDKHRYLLWKSGNF